MGRALKWTGLVILVMLAGWGVVLTIRVYKPFDHIAREPVYRAEGLLAIEFPMSESNAPERQVLIDEYISNQAKLIASHPVIQSAMNSRTFAETGLPKDNATFKRIAENLKAEHPDHSQFIKVFFIDKNKDTALATVRAIVSTYADYANTRLKRDDLKVMSALENRNAQLAGQIAQLHARLLDIANTSGLNLDRQIEVKLQEEARLTTLLNDSELQYESAKRATQAGGTTRPMGDAASLDLLKGRVEDISKKRQETQNSREAIQKLLVMSQDLTRQREELVKDRKDVQVRIDQVVREWNQSMDSVRVRVIQDGYVPLKPYSPE